PTHVGHDHVQQDKVVVLAVQPFQRFFTGSSFTHFVAFRSQGHSHHAANLRIVVNHQDAACAHSCLPYATRDAMMHICEPGLASSWVTTPRVLEFGHVRTKLLKHVLRADL